MAPLPMGPVVIYGSCASALITSFFLFPAMLLTGRHEAEDVMRRTGLLSMCVVIVLDLLWNNAHPQPVPLLAAAAAAAVSAMAQAFHLFVAYGLVEWIRYTRVVGIVLQISVLLPWVLVSQVGTSFIVRRNRSPARYQCLAWITVTSLGTLVTLLPWLRAATPLVLAVTATPRAMVAIALLCGSCCAGADGKAGGEAAGGEANGQEPPAVPLSRAFRFAFFACNGSTGEALNDMATDLKMRAALSSGDTQLTLSYNVAVLLSMSGGGYVSETLASGASSRCVFSCLWGLSQLLRSLGMGYLTPDRTWLMFVFVFVDKFTGPLGQAGIDTALLALLRRAGGDGAPDGCPRMPANAMWTLRAAAERLERPLCQLVLLSLGVGSAPPWLPIVLAALAVSFVVHTLAGGAADEKSVKSA